MTKESLAEKLYNEVQSFTSKDCKEIGLPYLKNNYRDLPAIFKLHYFNIAQWILDNKDEL